MVLIQLELNKKGVENLDRIKKNFGFGCMRLPMNGEKVDTQEFSKMVDTFIEQGFNYFDTAHGYLKGESEKALKECLTSRYDRKDYLLANKLTATYFNKEGDVKPFFESQLELCGVDYFDFYLMHAQSSNNYGQFKASRAYEQAFELKEAGKIRHVGLSFHDRPEVLDMILSENPKVEFVQIQFNYMDLDDQAIQSRRCAEICLKHNKPIIVMEPVKGGNLVNMPEPALKILSDLKGGSAASYAVRFAASQKGVFMVLSGMSNMEQMNDNLSTMKNFIPLNENEYKAIDEVRHYFKSLDLIGCTACQYCVEGCPEKIRIPDIFSAVNSYSVFKNWNTKFYYTNVITADGHGKASDCIQCGACEQVCPQHLLIRDLLVQAAQTFES